MTERLTFRDMAGEAYYRWNAPGGTSVIANAAITKLASYEDAEEQGRLIVLPCKVGDIIWVIERDEDDEESDDVEGYKFIAANDECVIVAVEPFGLDGSISEYLIAEETSDFGVDVHAFPIDDIYLTRAEAEAALAAQEGEQK